MRGETVFVVKRVTDSEDRFGNPVFTEQRTQVDNVLISFPSTSEFDDGGRWETSLNRLTLHFPKTYNKSLFGCFVEVRQKTYKVIGDPMWLTPEDTPTPWNYPVQVVRSDG